MKFSVFQVSRRGGRQVNEDRMGYSYTRASSILLLADGMGGHPEGEVAAQLALQAISALYQQEAAPEVPDVQAFLHAAVLGAHRQIIRYAMERGMLDTPRTTVVVALVQDGCASWAHCGDSRFYLVRDAKLVLRTRDHSYLEQPPKGHATNPRMQERMNRNVLYTCLGSPSKPVYDVAGPLPLQQGDRLMLCSDGLWSSVGEDEIVRQLGRHPVAQSIPSLVERALHNAGTSSDNVTAIAMEWETPDDVFETTQGAVLTDDMGADAYASSVRHELATPQMDELDEAAIERSIAEINDAIRRSAARKR